MEIEMEAITVAEILKESEQKREIKVEITVREKRGDNCAGRGR